jgi:L-fucose mutarotase
MLKRLPSVLTPALIYVMASIGHGDVLALVDANFPAASVAHSTVHSRAIYLAGADIPSALEAILSVLPLDTFIPTPANRMLVVDDPTAVPQVQRQASEVIAGAADEVSVGGLERFAFYDSARTAYAVGRTPFVGPPAVRAGGW